MLNTSAQRFEIDVVIDIKRVGEDAVDLAIDDRKLCVLGRRQGLHRLDVEALRLLFGLLLLGGASPSRLGPWPARIGASLAQLVDARQPADVPPDAASALGASLPV